VEDEAAPERLDGGHGGVELFGHLVALGVVPEGLGQVGPGDLGHAQPVLDQGGVGALAPDVAADVLGRLSAEEAMEILKRMDREEAEDIQELLGHEKDTAGGLMTTEFIAYPPGLAVSEVMEKFRKDAREMEAVYYVYTVEGEELVGAVSLRDLILAPPDAYISSIMETNLKTVLPEDDEMKFAETISKYNLVAIPVVDAAGNMLGVVTIDDIIDRLLPRKKRRRV
jgi:Mg/Co/Ni transporter MgtE